MKQTRGRKGEKGKKKKEKEKRQNNVRPRQWNSEPGFYWVNCKIYERFGAQISEQSRKSDAVTHAVSCVRISGSNAGVQSSYC